MDEPFQVTLVYSGCLKDEGALLAIDSLELSGCEGEDGSVGEMQYIM